MPKWLPLLCTLFFLLKSCAPRLETVEAPIEDPEPYTYTGTELIPERWWTSFRDPELNTLIDSALSANLDLAATDEQFRAASAVVRRESSFLWPQVDGAVTSSISRPEQEFSDIGNIRAGLFASYEIDLWGRIRSGIQAEEFRAQATYFDYQSAAMSLSAEIAITWYRLVSANKQLDLINEQIEINQDIVRLIRSRFTGGQVRAVDILRQEQLLESTRNQKIIYETDVVLLQNQLAVLLGRPPQNYSSPEVEELPEIPPLPDTGLPLELIRRRPDVRVAYNLVLAADRDMAQAIANKFPRLSLNLAAQVGSDNYSNLFQNWVYTLAGELVTPLLYGGRLRAEVDRTEAVKNQVLYQYGQTTLNAFREVEDALIREQNQEERLLVLGRQLDLAQKTNRQLRLEFLNGLTEYLDVLLSLDQEQQLQRDIIDAQQELLEYRIALYRALAGDFETNRPEGL